MISDFAFLALQLAKVATVLAAGYAVTYLMLVLA